MYIGCDRENGLPPRIYRGLSEIRRDILDISEKIEETKEMLNIRALLLDILINDKNNSAKSLIMELESTIAEAKEAFEELGKFNEELSMLEEELYETKCMMQR